MIMSLAACAAGFFLDFLFGDPVWLYHPVRLIGKGNAFGERKLSKLCCRNEKGGPGEDSGESRARGGAGAVLWDGYAGRQFLL